MERIIVSEYMRKIRWWERMEAENSKLREWNMILRQELKKIIDCDIGGIMTARYGYEDAKRFYIRNTGVFEFYGKKFYA